MASSPKVLVVIPCYNYVRYLGDAIGSVLQQSRRADFITLVDDGSTDGSLEVMQHHANAQGGISIIAQANSGVCAARNRAIRECPEADYVVCLDADDMLHPDFLRHTIPAMTEHVGMVYTRAFHFGARNQFVFNEQTNPNMQAQGNRMNSASLFRRKAWEMVGGYDVQTQGFEDWDLWLSMMDAGWEAKLVPEHLFFYRVHDQQQTLTVEKRRAELTVRIAHKHGWI